MKANFFKKVIIFLLAILILPSCFKDDDGAEKEQQLLQQYLAANNITVQPTASGLYYIETEEGTGPVVEANDYLIIKYTAQLISGRIFDTTDSLTAVQNVIYNPNLLYGPYKFKLSKVSLVGVKEGLSLMKQGGKARLIIPSKIGFGSISVGDIPAYSTLIYDIELLEVIKDPVAHENALLLEYLTANSITATPRTSGLYYIETLEGTGAYPQQGKTCITSFTGKLVDGRVFANVTGANTYSFVFGVTSIIPGFVEGVSLMKAGGKAIFIIPSSIGYGEDGSSNGIIAPYTTLIYIIELKEVIN